MPDELWTLELRELLLMREGRNRRHDQLIREMWEATRFQTFYLLNVHLDKKNMVKTPEKLIRFEWDKDKKQEVITPEQLEEMWNRFPDKAE